MGVNRCEPALKLEAIPQADQSTTFSLRNPLLYYKRKVHTRQKIWKEKYKRGKPPPMTQSPRTPALRLSSPTAAPLCPLYRTNIYADSVAPLPPPVTGASAGSW